ncbi:hypothetical protein GCM10027162_31680 [Streptomyces incanus]
MCAEAEGTSGPGGCRRRAPDRPQGLSRTSGDRLPASGATRCDLMRQVVVEAGSRAGTGQADPAAVTRRPLRRVTDKAQGVQINDTPISVLRLRHGPEVADLRRRRTE